MEVKRIPFEDLKAYWLEVDHFQVPGKKIREIVTRLGPYQCDLAEPRRGSYGLFDGENLVGGTHLVEWNATWLRYRTLNVRAAYRGGDWGWALIRDALALDWRDWMAPDRYLFGWLRDDHVAWARNHGFAEIDGHRQDGHLGMIRPLADL